jgi:hypothetical protein
MFTEDGLQCLSCEERPEMDDELGMSGQDEPNGTADNFSQVFELGAFRNLDINGPFRVNVEPGDDFGVQVVGSEARLNDVEVENRNGTLEIRFERVLNTYEGDLIEINVIMPEVQDLNLRSNAQLNLSNVRIDALNIELGGSSQGFLDVDADRISLNMVGASSLKLFGQSRQLDATMNGAARLEALDLQVRNASLETSGAAQAQVYVTEELNADAEDTSRIRYQGNPNINLGSGSEGRVSQVEPS